MSNQSLNPQPDNTVAGGVFRRRSFLPGADAIESLTLASDGTFKYEREDQIEGQPVDDPDDPAETDHSAPQITTVSGRWTYHAESGAVDLLIPTGSDSTPFMSLTLNGGGDLVVDDATAGAESLDSPVFVRDDGDWGPLTGGMASGADETLA
jgi:hypothetical protein